MSLDREHLVELAAAAWRAYDAASSPPRVTPAAPILFFGDLDAYLKSPLRVLTVALNPSGHEFPKVDPFSRFPLAKGVEGREPDRYFNALSAYFRTGPYSSWFSAFEQVLQGIGASYCPGATSAALQTEICSPVATDPTWSSLGKTEQAQLEAEGGPLWHSLLEALRPNLVLMSVAKRHLNRIKFKPIDGEWENIHTFDKKGNGEPRSRPYEVLARRHKIGGMPSLLVFGRAAQKPFSLLHDSQKRELGEIIRERYFRG